MSGGLIFLIVFSCILIVALTVILILAPCKAYFSALFSGCWISIFKLISMKMQKQRVSEIVGAYILAKKSKLDIGLADLQIVATSGGHPLNIVEGINAAKAAKLKFDFDFAKAVDISGRDCIEVVRECINSKVIELPLVTSVSRDNIEVNTKISLTLKVNLPAFLTGVSEDTISARAVEAVVTKIANSERATDLISRPELLDKAIFDAEIDENSKYELVSADVIHIGQGTNHGLSSEKDQIEKQRMLTANQLEQRRLTAVAVEQEMKAKEAEMRAKVVANEAEVPKAVIKAIEEGKIKNVVDFYKLQNLQADTEMRRHLIGKNSDED